MDDALLLGVFVKRTAFDQPYKYKTTDTPPAHVQTPAVLLFKSLQVKPPVVREQGGLSGPAPGERDRRHVCATMYAEYVDKYC
jgi:hypothetical protein